MGYAIPYFRGFSTDLTSIVQFLGYRKILEFCPNRFPNHFLCMLFLKLVPTPRIIDGLGSFIHDADCCERIFNSISFVLALIPILLVPFVWLPMFFTDEPREPWVRALALHEQTRQLSITGSY